MTLPLFGKRCALCGVPLADNEDRICWWCESGTKKPDGKPSDQRP